MGNRKNETPLVSRRTIETLPAATGRDGIPSPLTGANVAGSLLPVFWGGGACWENPSAFCLSLRQGHGGMNEGQLARQLGGDSRLLGMQRAQLALAAWRKWLHAPTIMATLRLPSPTTISLSLFRYDRYPEYLEGK